MDDGDIDSGDEDNHVRRGCEEEDTIDDEDQVCPICEREEAMLIHSWQAQERSVSPDADAPVRLAVTESQGPSEEAESEFAKELAKMLSDASDSRRADKRTALSMWDTSTLSSAVGVVGLKKKAEANETNEDSASREPGVMKFTLLSRKGNKQQVSSAVIALFIPGQLIKIFN